MNKLPKVMLIVFLLTTSVFLAQRKPDREKIKSLKVAFMTERLDLSSKEAQDFWPIYNDYEKKMQALRQKKHDQIRSKMRNADELSEKEAQDLLEKYVIFENEEEALNKDYLKTVSKVFSAKKTLLLLRSEEEFKRQLIKQYRQNRAGMRGER